ncbi:efflux RND transporter periplasmic adaptor subunit [Telluria mixta]|uniref:Efflux RND transporter periplasmic adaptor subunit n=1 Tax=Telluria mixta TaxID=34071 RepID=A0ABT2BVD0_9BURK|nr:efflux RND transporter periplasmic adaptor subunit [Telluria mixta]MCS0629016.1 efflux RND transporter periplasmic adaptor subunit [Telluria mixta]WEM97462.1 efflux RND transporter periplasmic adaptor subunit [Telluria mixta]
MKTKNIAIVVGVVVAVGAGTWILNHGSDSHADGAAAPGGKGKGAQPPAVVNVVAPQRQDVAVVQQANGTVTPIRTVDLHPQTTATIRQVHIKEGQFVKQGELMFSLDDREDRANLDKAQAQVERDRASLADLERQFKRSQDLFAQHFIAQSAVDTLRAQVDQARATLQADIAAARASSVTTSYTAIRAPMSGRVGGINVYPGSLVQPATSLTTVTQLDPITVAFTLPESSLPSLLAAQKRGKVEVEALPGADLAPVKGTLSFVDNTVDPQAGTIKVKAEFDNRETTLWPGQYVNTKVIVQTLKDAVVIPQNAIITNAQGTFVYVLEKDHSARLVPVHRVYGAGVDAAVSGLAGSEQVITDGKQNVRPGAKVRLASEMGKGKDVHVADKG